MNTPSITQIDSSTYETTFRGRIYTLVKNSFGWSMWNKPVNGRANPPKSFDDLNDVEKAYKHWGGIKSLVEVNDVRG